MFFCACDRGGIGRHAGLRSQWAKACGGSSPLDRTSVRGAAPYDPRSGEHQCSPKYPSDQGFALDPKRDPEMNSWKIMDEYELLEMTAEEFKPFFAEHHPRIFGNGFSCMPDDYLSEDEKGAQKKLAGRMGDLFCLRIGIFHQGEQIGWSLGIQQDRGQFHMINSAIFPEHRRKGLYSAMLGKVIKTVTEQGFQLITSGHIATNSAIIVSKLKAGFIITGFELSDMFGLMVNLTYYTNATRRKIMDFRAGHIHPDAELRRLFGI